MLIGRLLQGVDTPILTIDEHDSLPYRHRINIQFTGHLLRKIVSATHLQPVATTIWVQAEILVLDYWRVLEKPKQEMLLSILLAGIEFHAFLLEPSRSISMRAHTAKLIDARVVGLIKLHVDLPFPFNAFHPVVARMRRVGRIVKGAWDEVARLVVEQRQGIGHDRQHRHAMKVAIERTDEIGVADHLTHTTAVWSNAAARMTMPRFTSLGR